MSKHSNHKSYCLNRLMMTELSNPENIDPLKIIRKFCDFDNSGSVKKLFRKCCKIAIDEKYLWKGEAPGKLLYFYEQLEGLIEAFYLIYERKGFKKKLSQTTEGYENAESPDLPCSLTTEELKNPLLVINDFFEERNLTEWKRFMHYWLEAGLSNYSVLESIESEDILPYYNMMEKVLDASYQLTAQNAI